MAYMIRMDDENDFIVTHCFSLWSDYRIAHPGVRTGVGRGKARNYTRFMPKAQSAQGFSN
jgi:hypothetical protein